MVGARDADMVVAAAVIAFAVACTGCASPGEATPSVAREPAASISCGLSAAPPPVAAPVPPGWTSVSSPWLGYSVAVPASWGLRGHVRPGDARAPYDVFGGTIPGSALEALLVVGCNPVTDTRASGRLVGQVAVDGTTMEVFESTADEPGRVVLFAKGMRGDTEWHLMALAASDGDASAFFSEVISTFRFPAPTLSMRADQ